MKVGSPVLIVVLVGALVGGALIGWLLTLGDEVRLADQVEKVDNITRPAQSDYAPSPVAMAPMATEDPGDANCPIQVATPKNGAKMLITASALNVRTCGKLSCQVVGTLPHGPATLDILDMTDCWAHVTLPRPMGGHKEGWISAHWFKVTN